MASQQLQKVGADGSCLRAFDPTQMLDPENHSEPLGIRMSRMNSALGTAQQEVRMHSRLIYATGDSLPQPQLDFHKILGVQWSYLFILEITSRKLLLFLLIHRGILFL